MFVMQNKVKTLCGEWERVNWIKITQTTLFFRNKRWYFFDRSEKQTYLYTATANTDNCVDSALIGLITRKFPISESILEARKEEKGLYKSITRCNWKKNFCVLLLTVAKSFRIVLCDLFNLMNGDAKIE